MHENANGQKAATDFLLELPRSTPKHSQSPAMDSVLIIRDRKGDCRIPLLSKDAALARLPSLAEASTPPKVTCLPILTRSHGPSAPDASQVFEVLADLNLDGQCKGLASLLMQQPGIHVALGRFMVSSVCIGPLSLAAAKVCRILMPGMHTLT